MKLNVTFAPGCFDFFEGTQEELDQWIKEIQEAFENGDFILEAEEYSEEEFETSTPRILQ
jgi:hypothetical protein